MLNGIKFQLKPSKTRYNCNQSKRLYLKAILNAESLRTYLSNSNDIDLSYLKEEMPRGVFFLVFLAEMVVSFRHFSTEIYLVLPSFERAFTGFYWVGSTS